MFHMIKFVFIHLWRQFRCFCQWRFSGWLVCSASTLITKNPYLFLEETSRVFQMNSLELLPRGRWSEHTRVLRSSGTGICCSISVSDPPVCTQFVMLGLGLCRTTFSFDCWVSVRTPVGSSGEWLRGLEGEETYPVQFAPCSCQQCPFIVAVHLVQVSRFYFHVLWSGLIMPSWMQ